MSSSSLSLPLIELAHKQIKFTTGLGWIWSCRPAPYLGLKSQRWVYKCCTHCARGMGSMGCCSDPRIKFCTSRNVVTHMPLSDKLCQAYSVRYRMYRYWKLPNRSWNSGNAEVVSIILVHLEEYSESMPTEVSRVEEKYKELLCPVSWSIHNSIHYYTTWLVMVTLSPPVAVSMSKILGMETWSLLTNSVLVYEPKYGGGGGLWGLSQWEQLCAWRPNTLWRSNSIFNLWMNSSVYIQV